MIFISWIDTDIFIQCSLCRYRIRLDIQSYRFTQKLIICI